MTEWQRIKHVYPPHLEVFGYPSIGLVGGLLLLLLLFLSRHVTCHVTQFASFRTRMWRSDVFSISVPESLGTADLAGDRWVLVGDLLH